MNKSLDQVPIDMQHGMTEALKVWVDMGWPNAVIPAYADYDNDGEVDYFGLNAFGQLELLGEDQVEAKDETEAGYTGPAWVRS